MVRQYVQRGDIVPGGGIEDGETPEEACIREVKEETGFDVKIKRLLVHQDKKYSFECEIAGGSLSLDKNIEDNADIIEVRWVHLSDELIFDAYTKPVIELLKNESCRKAWILQ